MPEDTEEALDTGRQWVTAVLYAGLVAGNLLIVWDWWRDTPQGQAFRARAHARVAALRQKAQGCEGCARRKARLRQLWEHKVEAAAESAVMEATAIVTEGKP